MSRLYSKNPLGFALMWIFIYVGGSSFTEKLSRTVGMEKCITLPFYIVMSLWLLHWLHRGGLFKEYGLCAPRFRAGKMLWYLPLLLLCSCNAWFGLRMNMSAAESCLYVLTMLLVGFLEELIFRGFLFRAMCRDGVKSAIIVSSITFGLGHIINLFNGSGMALGANLLQVCYAIAIGYLFVIIFYKAGSLIPRILTHSFVNALSAFAVQPETGGEIISAALLCIISLSYGIYLNKKLQV